MMERQICVTIDGKKEFYPEGIPYEEIAKNHQSSYKDPIILVMTDGKLRELHKRLRKDCMLSFITTADPIGHKTYKRSACLLLLKAIYDVAGKENLEKVVLHFAVTSGYFFTVRGNVTVDENFAARVKERMQEMAAQEIPIVKESVGTDEAVERFHRHGMYDKEKLFRYRRVSRVNVYSLEKFEDYFYGFMAPHTGYIRYFDLLVYEQGLVLVLPKASAPTKIPDFVPQPKLFHVQMESERWGELQQMDTVGALNDRISKEGIERVLLIQEAMHESRISSIAARIAGKKTKKFIMIAGPSSSGKTTFSHRLSIQLAAHGLKPHPIAMDNYFKNREDTPLDAFGEKNFECLEAIDVEQFNRDMTDLLDGKRVELPEFNFKTGHREYKGNYLQLGREDVLVLEGIHGLNQKLSYSLPEESKFKIYISALTQLNIDEHNRIPTTDGRLIRRIVRDARTRGTSAKETIARWPSVRRGETENIFPYQEEADEIFNSALIYELACLKVYAEPLLFGIDKTEPEYMEAKRLLKFFDYFVPVPSQAVPHNSILREFIGGSCFQV
ncbi:MAG TPA: nucleoside kinase [Candidatus Blautia gallistercoris]|uniref:Nucleoside kinase n=1 Tax=Candidatus Blautia gallistercoris TaxID=2838490 RepID=A0A9D2B329_9FIRM|nr:nucleoside kinase [Candidatus Blautia gallistercoris]